MSKENERLATFKIEDKKWTRFKVKARKAGKTATDVLLGFIDNYLESDIDEIGSIDIDNQDSIDKLQKKLGIPSLKDDLTNEIKDYVDSIIQGLNDRLSAFDERLGLMEVGINSKDIDDIENIDLEKAIAKEPPTTTEPEEEVIAPKPPENEPLPSDYSKLVRNDAIANVSEGLTSWDFAKKLGIPESTVRGWRDRGQFSNKQKYAHLKEEWEILEGLFYPKETPPEAMG